MSGEDHFRPTPRKKPVNVIPDAEADAHIPGGYCRCRPTLETWTLGGAKMYRLMHRPLADPAASPPDGQTVPL